MKTQCDENCDTCNMQTQVHCALVFSKANNANIKALVESLGRVESKIEENASARVLSPIQEVEH